MDPPIGPFGLRVRKRKDERDFFLTFYHNGFKPKGVPRYLPRGEQLFLLLDSLGREGKPFHRLIEWAGVRYVLLLEHNEDTINCKENVCLKKVYDALSNGFKGIEEAEKACMKLFWSFLKSEYERRSDTSEESSENAGLGSDGGCPVNIQLKTLNGELRALKHTKHLNNYGDPVRNPFPDLRAFEKSQITYVAKIHEFVYRVKVDGADYCLKRICFMRDDAFLIELKRMYMGQGHPNIMKLCGVVKTCGGLIDGFLMPFLWGMTLEHVKNATTDEKERWKKSISNALRFLHNKNLIWGDAKPDNVFVTKEDRQAYLFDFEGGYTYPYIPSDLSGTKDGDLHALELISSFIDNIDTGS